MQGMNKENNSKQKDGRLFIWFEKHIAWIVGIALFIIIALIGIWVFMQLQYCIDHPDCDWCKATNATGIIKIMLL